MVEPAKNLFQAPRGRALRQMVRQGLNPELQGLPADLLVAKGGPARSVMNTCEDGPCSRCRRRKARISSP
jgi:hypothetical protein